MTTPEARIYSTKKSTSLAMGSAVEWSAYVRQGLRLHDPTRRRARRAMALWASALDVVGVIVMVMTVMACAFGAISCRRICIALMSP